MYVVVKIARKTYTSHDAKSFLFRLAMFIHHTVVFWYWTISLLQLPCLLAEKTGVPVFKAANLTANLVMLMQTNQ